MSGALVIAGSTFGGTGGGGGGGGGGVALSAVIGAGQIASAWNSDSWEFDPNTCVASGGTAPYSYAWSWSGPDAALFGFTGSSTAATCTPSVSGVASGPPAVATLICTVTDAAATVVASAGSTYQYVNLFF